MKPLTLLTRILAAWILLVVVQVVSAIIVQEKDSTGDNALAWFLLSNLLVALVLCFLAVRSDWHGMGLALALSGVPLLINLANDIDGILFLTSSGIEWKKEITRILLASVCALPFWMLIFASRGDRRTANYRPFESRRVSERLWRFVVSDLAYCILYFVAGGIIWAASSHLRDFYATQNIPAGGKLFALQLLVRGPIYVVACLVLVRMLGLPGRAGTLALGLSFAVLNVVPLLIPTKIFPDAVRWAHFCEVVSSSLLFGLFVGWIWKGPRLGANRIMKQAA